MNVVDSSGWLEYFGGGSSGARFAAAIQNVGELIVPTIIIYEVFKRITAQRNEEEALKAAGLMSLGQVVDLTRDLAIEAASLSLELKLPMADSMILATARSYSADLWTQDEHFKGLDGVIFLEKEA